MLQRAIAEGRCEVEGWRCRKDGSRFWANAVIDTIRDGSGAVLGFAKVTRDMSDRRRYEEHLYRLAHFDPLTELPNREALRTALREALNAEPPVTVLMLDLDGFKEINDTLGHAAGDAILKAAAHRLAASARKAWLGGSAATNSPWFCPALPMRRQRDPFARS